MFYGFRERELILSVFETITGLRMNHAYVRPGGWLDLPDEAVPQLRDLLDLLPKRLKDLENLLNENYIWKARTQGIGYLDLTGCIALGITGPVLRSTGLPHDLRKSQPYCGYETYDFDVITDDGCDSYGRYLIRVKEMRESLKIVEQCVDRLKPGRVMIDDKKLAWPADLQLGPDGLGNSPEHIAKIMGHSMEGLIHHFKLVTEGIRVPAGQVYIAVESRVASSACTWSPTVGPGPTGCTTGTRRSPTCRRWPRCARAAWSRTPSPLWPPSTRSWAGSTDDRGRVPAVGAASRRGRAADQRPGRLPGRRAGAAGSRRRADRRALPAGALGAASAAASGAGRRRLPHPGGPRVLRAQLGLTAAEVTAVATFYSMYRRTPTGDYLVGVCTNTLCAIMGGDVILEALQDHLGIHAGETTGDGRITLDHVECNAACDYAPVVMVNWEFFDNQTPSSARDLVDGLRAGQPPVPTRGAPLCTFRGRAHPGRPARHAQPRPGPGRPPPSQGCGWPRSGDCRHRPPRMRPIPAV